MQHGYTIKGKIVFHIFNRLQLVSDIVSVVCKSNDVVVSKFGDYENNLPGKPLNYITNICYSDIEQIKAKNNINNDVELFMWLFNASSTARQMRFYADKETYVLMLTKTLKMLFGDTFPSTLAYGIYCASLDWLFCRVALRDDVVQGSTFIDLKNYKVLYYNKQQFETLYNNTNFDGDKEQLNEWLNTIRTQLSNEYIILNYLITGNDFDNRASMMVDRLINQSVVDLARDYIESDIVAGNIVVDDQLIEQVTMSNAQYVQRGDMTECPLNQPNTFSDIFVELKSVVNKSVDEKLQLVLKYMKNDPIVYGTILCNGNSFDFNPRLFSYLVSQTDYYNNFILSFVKE